MSVDVAIPARPSLHALVRRPDGIAESARWLFLWLTLASLVLALPADLSSARGAMPIVAMAAGLTLAGSWIAGYRRRAVPIALDLVDAVAIAAFALAGPTPVVILPFLFPALWFRSLYGTTGRSILRGSLFLLAAAAAMASWRLVPGHRALPALAEYFAAVPTVFLTVIASRQLGRGLLARERAVRRDAALAAMGARLLGMTDENAIRELGWATTAEICAATPGLRVILSRVVDGVLDVQGVAGDFDTVPTSLPIDVVRFDPQSGEPAVCDRRPLDRSVGTGLEWVGTAFPSLRAACLIVGAPGSISPEALVAVRTLVNQLALAVSNRRYHMRLIAQAGADALTGLANRTSFTAAVSESLNPSGAGPVHVLFLDLDDFKDVNDELGHAAGDAVLIEVANRLRRCTRPADVCARLGGDEFAVLLRDGDERDAAEVARRIVDAVAEPIDLGARMARVATTIGISTGAAGTDAGQLVNEADLAMYAAKSEGKGRIRFFDAHLMHLDPARIPLVDQLAGATVRGEFVVHYQPILALPDLRCVAVEALVRWRHPERGLLAAAEFIDAAERTGAITGIGEFVLDRACADAAAWPDVALGFAPSVTINVSAHQVAGNRFGDLVRRSLDRSGLAPERLVLEIALTEALSSPAITDRLTALAAAGVSLVIDEFGRGYSPWPALRSLPITAVKLDRDLVAGAVDNRVDRAVLRSIVSMSAELGVRTIATGVERLALQEILGGIGADEVQGYLYSPPISLAALRHWLLAQPRRDAMADGSVRTLVGRRTA